MGGKGKRGGRKPLPPAPQPRESWVPQTAARRGECRFPYGADDDEPVEAGSGAGTGIGSQRRTSAPRSNRGGRGRPSGKRR